MKFLKRIWHFLKKYFWKRPTGPERATQALSRYTVIVYKGQRINLEKDEVEMFYALARSDKRAMAKKFEKMEKAGKVKFMEIKGVLTCVYNRDYEKRINKP